MNIAIQFFALFWALIGLCWTPALIRRRIRKARRAQRQQAILRRQLKFYKFRNRELTLELALLITSRNMAETVASVQAQRKLRLVRNDEPCALLRPQAE